MQPADEPEAVVLSKEDLKKGYLRSQLKSDANGILLYLQAVYAALACIPMIPLDEINEEFIAERTMCCGRDSLFGVKKVQALLVLGNFFLVMLLRWQHSRMFALIGELGTTALRILVIIDMALVALIPIWVNVVGSVYTQRGDNGKGTAFAAGSGEQWANFCGWITFVQIIRVLQVSHVLGYVGKGEIEVEESNQPAEFEAQVIPGSSMIFPTPPPTPISDRPHTISRSECNIQKEVVQSTSPSSPTTPSLRKRISNTSFVFSGEAVTTLHELVLAHELNPSDRMQLENAGRHLRRQMLLLVASGLCGFIIAFASPEGHEYGDGFHTAVAGFYTLGVLWAFLFLWSAGIEAREASGNSTWGDIHSFFFRSHKLDAEARKYWASLPWEKESFFCFRDAIFAICSVIYALEVGNAGGEATTWERLAKFHTCRNDSVPAETEETYDDVFNGGGQVFFAFGLSYFPVCLLWIVNHVQQDKIIAFGAFGMLFYTLSLALTLLIPVAANTVGAYMYATVDFNTAMNILSNTNVTGCNETTRRSFATTDKFLHGPNLGTSLSFFFLLFGLVLLLTGIGWSAAIRKPHLSRFYIRSNYIAAGVPSAVCFLIALITYICADDLALAESQTWAMHSKAFWVAMIFGLGSIGWYGASQWVFMRHAGWQVSQHFSNTERTFNDEDIELLAQ